MSSLHGERQERSSVIEPTGRQRPISVPRRGCRPAGMRHPGLHRQRLPQGMALMVEASALHDYKPALLSIAQIWKGGCIIARRLLQRTDAYDTIRS